MIIAEGDWMYRIGEFSKMSKTTVKALRYFEKEELLKPVFIDSYTGYRFYESNQLVDVSRIISLRQAGLSIKEIKSIFDGVDVTEILQSRKAQIEKTLDDCTTQLSKINYLLEGQNMKNEIFVKEIPEYNIYYCDGIVADFSEISQFAFVAGTECAKANPNLKCVFPDYCYISYLDGEYKEKDIKIRYAQAVEKFGNETNRIKFAKSKSITAVCIYHKGRYDNLRDSYNALLKYVENNGYEIIDNPRECYIDGCWNKDNEADYLTEIQIPIAKAQ